MAEYKVYNPDIDNYGIYDYFKLKGYHKSYGIIKEDKYVFKIDIADHRLASDEFKTEEGPYNVLVCADTAEGNCLEVIHLGNKTDEIKDFQYECIIGLLKECQKYINEANAEFEFIMSDDLFTDKNLSDGKNDINAIIEDIETKYNMLYGKKK